MADNRRAPEPTEPAVPKARAGESPEAAEPRPPAEPVKAAKPSKATKATKATKTAKAAKAATTAEPAKATTAPRTAKASKSAGQRRPAKAAKAANDALAGPPAPPPLEPTTPPLEPAAVSAAPGAWAAAGSWAAAPGAWAAAAWEALQHADQPPKALAELAVAELGPRAARWADWLRRTYPDAPVHGLVRLATHQAARDGLALALAEAGGPVTAPLLLPATAWVRATVVLRVAAAYGLDPTDSRRASELIALLDLDPTAAGEPLALSGAGRLATLAGAAATAGRFGIIGLATRRLGLRRTPAAALRALAAASEHTDQLRLLASRANQYYHSTARS